MTKQELINKYAKKCDEARERKDIFRRSKFENKKKGNQEEACWDELEQEACAKEFYLCEEFIRDLKELS
ncbi:hypothetical protein KO561_05210 [Radiobacillus kanasensis]|uniref:hypothetical protein n=1 Tax=Radiobacillus kanasensis TaxID=2844358 RepID=UPI001E5703CE|nr:hypothetical protein [Radiobacillus kanasensis]UFU00349.1 hypothetical protein KO561_05210 [Radiobacillus kanasensis]